MLKEIRTSIMALLVFTVLTGLLYPLSMAVIGFGLFGDQAKGSLVTHQGTAVGSKLIGQPFDAPQYFWGRPSATSPAYNAAASSGSNLAASNPAQADLVTQRVQKLRNADPENKRAIPIDLITASGSGLDPHISPAAAHYQCERVARARKLDAYELHKMIDKHTEGRQWGVLGEPRVNVLMLNLSLDGKLDSILTHSWKDPI